MDPSGDCTNELFLSAALVSFRRTTVVSENEVFTRNDGLVAVEEEKC